MKKSFFLCPFLFQLLIIHHLFVCSIAATNITTDQISLLSLKDYVTSDSFQLLANNWSSSSSACEWIGVTCGSRHQRVIGLNISNMDLKGTIPPHFGNLSFLVSLDLSGNNFSGDFPIDLSRLGRLRYLNFNANNFGGEIPSWLDSLKNLQILYLEKNRLTGDIPPSLFNLSNLVELKLSNNVLLGSIPAEIGKLSRLKTLALGFNLLTGDLTPEIFNITTLEYIWMSDTVLHGSLPYNTCDNLRSVKVVDLSRTLLNGPILSILSNCTQLRWLALANCGFGGPIPQEIGNLKALQTLYLGNNNLTGM